MLAAAFLGAPFAAAQHNLGFGQSPSGPVPTGTAVPGWDARGDADTEMALDSNVAHSGAASLRVVHANARGRERFSQQVDTRALGTNRVRVSAYVKTSGPAARASLRVRVDGGTGILYIGRSEPAESVDTGWTRIEIQAPLAASARQLEFGGELSGAGSAWFDDFRIEPVRTQDLPPPSAPAARYVGQALAIIDEHAVVRAALDWPALHAAVMAQARGAVTPADAHLAVQYALASLRDGHSYFMSPRQMENLNERPVGNARTSREPRPPRVELLAGAVGYLQLPGFAGGGHLDRVAFAEELQALIAAVDAVGVCGWIVDLRDNQGGNLWPMLAGLGPLLGDGDAGASVRPDGGRRAIWYRDGKAGLGDYVQLRVRGTPYRLRRTDAPVAAITDEETASAAEIVAAAFAARPQTRSFGAATRGATTATQTFPLYDGAALMLAVAQTTDRHGRVIAGPIAPDERIGAGLGGEPLAEQPAIRAARRWLEAQPCSVPAASGS